jgi:hypothetical protein
VPDTIVPAGELLPLVLIKTCPLALFIREHSGPIHVPSHMVMY